jgi:hypothetical protein
LRDAQAENDGENDCEITELIPAAASALSPDKTSVDHGSLHNAGGSKPMLAPDLRTKQAVKVSSLWQPFLNSESGSIMMMTSSSFPLL